MSYKHIAIIGAAVIALSPLLITIWALFFWGV